MDVKIGKDIFGRSFNYLTGGLVKGRNILKANGYNVCENILYYKKENSYYHYNRIM